MATTTTKTTKKKKLVYKQDPDGVFRLKKINDDTSSLKTNEIVDKKAQVDNYLNELIDCSYSIIDDDTNDVHSTAQTATPEEHFNRITTPATATAPASNVHTTAARRKKIKPTIINTSSKNLKLKTTSPVPTAAAVATTTPIEPQHVVVTTRSEASPPPAPPLSSPPSPTLVPSPTDFTVKTTIKEEQIDEEDEDEEEEKELEELDTDHKMAQHNPTLLTRLLSHVPAFILGVISTCLGSRYKQQLLYSVLGVAFLGIALGVITLLGICSCLYLGLIKTDDLKKYADYFLNPKVIKETVIVKDQMSEPPTPESEREVEHVVEEKIYQPPEESHEEVEDVAGYREYQPEEMYEEEKPVEPQYPVKPQQILLPEAYSPLPEPKPPKMKKSPSTVKVKPYRYEQRDHKVFNVVPINNSIPLPNSDPRYHIKPKPDLIRASTEPSRQNSRRRKRSGSSSPNSAKSENYYQSHPVQVGAPPQLFKIKQLPNLPPQAEELPFINEVRLVDGYGDEKDADEIITPTEAPANHYKTGSAHNTEFLKRNHSTMSKQSVLGTRTNYKKFVSNVPDDYEY
ncbi:hypothetical protein Cantr_06598 [Candida viswanathii]|uniref:Uncharacterized protein n=1 Tax=Candida viswanathii TaxID=5486 RepID=A0A367XWS4_9ASCO|nr:hypothetical protein Cantr_06598 [Candida viswanathii]